MRHPCKIKPYTDPKGVNSHGDPMGMVGGVGLEEVIKEV